MAEEIGSEEKEKSLYLTLIRSLDEQLERCQLKCDELEKQIRDRVSLCNALEKDNEDITEYLNQAVAAEERKAEELVELLESRRQEAEREEEALRLHHRQEVQELQEQAARLKSESEMQVAKLAEQEEQLTTLMRQVSALEPLEKLLIGRREEHEAAVHGLKMEAALEKEKMTEERRRAVDDCIQTRVPAVLLEETARHSEQREMVRVLLEETADLWREKDALQGREADLCSDMDKLGEDLAKVSQAVFNQKTETEQLMNKCQRLRVKLREWGTTHERWLAEDEALREQLVAVSEERRHKAAEVDQLGAELGRERSRGRRLGGEVQEAAVTLRHILTDSEETSETLRRLQTLLGPLESSVPRGTCPAPDDPTERSGRGRMSQASGPKSAREESLNLDTDPLFLLARYRPGDLGLVPPPTGKPKPRTHRTGPWPAAARPPPSRRLGPGTSSSLDPPGPAPRRTDSEAGASTSADGKSRNSPQSER